MRALLAAALFAQLSCAAGRRLSDDSLVDVAEFEPRILVDIRYATADNFTGRVLYDSPRCLLRLATARRLRLVQDDLSKSGLGLKVWDCYRPLSIQKKLWELVPDPRYVADPAKGSRHNRGASVDLSLVDSSSQELPMPTAFDDFSQRAHRDFSDAPPAALANRTLLEEAMSAHGFVGLKTEWWHFDDKDWARFPLMDIPVGKAAQ